VAVLILVLVMVLVVLEVQVEAAVVEAGVVGSYRTYCLRIKKYLSTKC
jgi:hypothetical protein